jgi:hypothetical protein
LVGWALFAALAPTLLGIDHSGLRSMYEAGDHTAFDLKLHSGSTYPLRTLAPTAAGAGLLALVAMRIFRNRPRAPRVHGDAAADPRRRPALSA